MAETGKLALPLLAGGQAQKHVTVNEALARLDALTQIVLLSRGAATPPAGPAEGDVHAVGTAATGDWAGQAGRLAIRCNGGWQYADPAPGWRAWLAAEGTSAVHDGVDWVAGAGAVSLNGAGFLHRTFESDHAIGAGASFALTGALPGGCVVYGITGRVLDAIGGAASFAVGTAVSPDRYGSGIGTGAGAWLRGMTGSPLASYAAEDLVLTAEGGSFDGSGTLRLAVHVAELSLPRA